MKIQSQSMEEVRETPQGGAGQTGKERPAFSALSGEQKAFLLIRSFFRALRVPAIYLLSFSMVLSLGRVLFHRRLTMEEFLSQSGNFYIALGLLVTCLLLKLRAARRGSRILSDVPLLPRTRFPKIPFPQKTPAVSEESVVGVSEESAVGTRAGQDPPGRALPGKGVPGKGGRGKAARAGRAQLRRSFLCLLSGMALSVFFIGIYFLFGNRAGFLQALRALSMLPGTDLPLCLFSALFLMPFLEEIVFRGYMQGELLASALPPSPAIFLTAAVYALFHAGFWMGFPVFLCGLLLSRLALWKGGAETGRSGMEMGQNGTETGRGGMETGKTDMEIGQSSTETGQKGMETGHFYALVLHIGIRIPLAISFLLALYPENPVLPLLSQRAVRFLVPFLGFAASFLLWRFGIEPSFGLRKQ